MPTPTKQELDATCQAIYETTVQKFVDEINALTMIFNDSLNKIEGMSEDQRGAEILTFALNVYGSIATVILQHAFGILPIGERREYARSVFDHALSLAQEDAGSLGTLRARMIEAEQERVS